MENLYYNLSEEEFSKGRKILLWSFAALFFFAGLYILVASLVFGQKSIPAVLSTAPFGISLVVFIIAGIATFKGTDLFFSIDKEKIDDRPDIADAVDLGRRFQKWNTEIPRVTPPRPQHAPDEPSGYQLSGQFLPSGQPKAVVVDGLDPVVIQHDRPK